MHASCIGTLDGGCPIAFQLVISVKLVMLGSEMVRWRPISAVCFAANSILPKPQDGSPSSSFTYLGQQVGRLPSTACYIPTYTYKRHFLVLPTQQVCICFHSFAGFVSQSQCLPYYVETNGRVIVDRQIDRQIGRQVVEELSWKKRQKPSKANRV